MTKEILDLTIMGKLIMLSGVIFAEGHSTADELPDIVTLTGGPFIEKFRGNRQVLQDIGNVLRLRELPTRQPSGAWALSIGLALNQLWREQASRAVVEDNTARFRRPFTRYQLLDIFRSEPWVESILNGDNPKRAQRYWNEAIQLLKKYGLIRQYTEIDSLPLKRSGWQEFWLRHQRLDIRPEGESLDDVIELARSGKRAANNKSRTGAFQKAGSYG